MILRRIAEAIRQRNWFTVLFEIMIVVLGVFLGLQANNWNEARADRNRSERHVSRIRAGAASDRLPAATDEAASAGQTALTGNSP